MRNLTLTLPKIASSNTFTNFALAVGLYKVLKITLLLNFFALEWLTNKNKLVVL